MATVLVIEDERDLVRLLSYNLKQDGFRVIDAQDGESGLKLAIREKPDAVILDLMLPRMNGMEVCRALRAQSNVPILILSARSEEIDRILGLEIGADDYLGKPFSLRELVARVKALLRRNTRSATPTKQLSVGSLKIDLDRYVLARDDKPIALSSREFQLLRILIEAEGKALTRDQLLEKIWGYEASYEIDTRTVDQHVARLRSKFGTDSGRIVTVKNVGYRIDLS